MYSVMYSMSRKTHNKTRRNKMHRRKSRRRRPSARGLMQSRPGEDAPPTRRDAARHRRQNPPKKTLHGKVPGHMEGELAALGLVAYGSAVSTNNPRIMAAEDRAMEKSARRGLGKHRRGPTGLGETQKAFTGLVRTNSASSDSSIESRSPQLPRTGRAWNPLDSYGESPSAKSPSATRRSAPRGRGRKRKTKAKRRR